MSDQLYLSLWFPNFRLQALPDALVCVLRQFITVSREGGAQPELARVTAASAYPIDWAESPIYQRIYVNDERSEASEADTSLPENAVAEATEQLHDDTAYEFEMRWKLWAPETVDAQPGNTDIDIYPDFESVRLDTLWKREPSTVRILGFGPGFDDATFEQNGHIRIDFGLDTPWLAETIDDEDLDDGATKHIQQNVEMLLAFTLSVEKNCGISSRLLWTESGEPLAQKLIDRLQRVN